jgi:hypothetical protein
VAASQQLFCQMSKRKLRTTTHLKKKTEEYRANLSPFEKDLVYAIPLLILMFVWYVLNGCSEKGTRPGIIIIIGKTVHFEP